MSRRGDGNSAFVWRAGPEGGTDSLRTPETQTAAYECPFGIIEISAADGKLFGVRLGRPGRLGGRRRIGRVVPGGLRVFFRQLDAYFGGRPISFDLSRVNLTCATDFQRRVYSALARIGFGQVISYADLAELSGCLRAVRAAGGAVGKNPVPVFIPCHRVVRADGRIAGFSAGIEWKRSLLRHEGWAVRGDRIVKKEPTFPGL